MVFSQISARLIAEAAVRSQEPSVTCILIIDEQGGVQLGQPVPQDIMRDGNIFFDVVVNNMPVGAVEIFAQSVLRSNRIWRILQVEVKNQEGCCRGSIAGNHWHKPVYLRIPVRWAGSPLQAFANRFPISV